MSFQPVLPAAGLSGWRFLNATLDRQSEAFEASQSIRSDTEYFRENIGKITSAEDLVADRRLLSVALGAFGLEGDIANTYFMRKVLEDGTTADDALANRLANKSYKAFSEAFSFGAGMTQGNFAESIIEKFERRSFEVAVGAQNETFRFGLNLKRELPQVAQDNGSADARWFGVMGNPALREVFQTAFGLPAQFGQVDIDQQLDVFKDNARRRFGTDDLVELSQPDQMEDLLQTYFLQNQISQTRGASGASVALALLQSATPL